MSINTHVRYSMSCDKCGLFYWLCNNRENQQGVFASVKLLRFCAKQDGWVIHEHGSELECYCPDCCRKDAENE